MQLTSSRSLSQRSPSPPGFVLGLALVSTLALSSCMTDGVAMNDREASTTPAEGAATLSDGEIAGVTAAIHQGEISHARIAQERAQSREVRSFAEQMIEQHTRGLRELEGLANSAGVAPEPSALREELTAQVLQLEQDLAARDPQEFDRAYMDAQVMLHERSLDIADRQLMPSVKNEQLRAYLLRVRPLIAQHLEMARQISAGQPLAAR